MWLASNTRSRCPPLDYESLLSSFGVCSIKSRFIQADLLFLRSVYSGRIDCPHLTAAFGLPVPGRRCRLTGLFYVSFGRVNTVKSGFLTRIPVLCNRFLQEEPGADVLDASCPVVPQVRAFARSQGAYI